MNPSKDDSGVCFFYIRQAVNVPGETKAYAQGISHIDWHRLAIGMVCLVTGTISPEIYKYDGLGFYILSLEDKRAEQMSDEDSEI